LTKAPPPGHPVRERTFSITILPIGQSFEIYGLAFGRIGLQPPPFHHHGPCPAVFPTALIRRHVFEDFPQGNPDLHEMRHQSEDVAELTVGSRSAASSAVETPQLPCRNVIERGLPGISRFDKCSAAWGVVEQLEVPPFADNRAFAQQQRHHKGREEAAPNR